MSHSFDPVPDAGGKRRPNSRLLAASAVMLVIAVILLGLSMFRALRPARSGRQNAFLLPGEPDTFYAAAGNGLAAASPSGARLYSSTGRCAAEADAAMEKPVCVGSSAVSVYYDMGRSGLLALYPDGACRRQDTEGGVTFADVNETGLITVIMDKDGAMGSVLVLDTDLTPLFRWDAVSGHPVEARTGGDDILCVNTLSQDGSTLRFFRIDRTDELGRIVLPGELVVDIGFLADGTPTAVTTERLLFASTAGEIVLSHSFQGGHLNAFCLQGRFVAVETVSGESGANGILTTLDASGAILGSRAVPGAVDALSSSGDRLLVLFVGEESTLYTSALEEIVSYQPDADVRRVFLTPDGNAYFAGNSGVTQIDFDR